MNKVLVYDWGWGGGVIGKYIEDELGVKTARVIDQGGMALLDSSAAEVCAHVEKALLPYIGTAEVIVLGNPTVTVLTEEHLRWKFPRQKFVGFGLDLDAVAKGAERAIVLAPMRIRRTEKYQMMKARCEETEIWEPDSEKWMLMAQKRIDGRAEVEEAMHGMTQAKVVVYHPKVVLLQRQLEELVGWRGEVVDMKPGMVEELKKALDIRY